MDFISGRSEAAGDQIRVITHAADLWRILTRDEVPDLRCYLQSRLTSGRKAGGLCVSQMHDAVISKRIALPGKRHGTTPQLSEQVFRSGPGGVC